MESLHIAERIELMLDGIEQLLSLSLIIVAHFCSHGTDVVSESRSQTCIGGCRLYRFALGSRPETCIGPTGRKGAVVLRKDRRVDLPCPAERVEFGESSRDVEPADCGRRVRGGVDSSEPGRATPADMGLLRTTSERIVLDSMECCYLHVHGM